MRIFARLLGFLKPYRKGVIWSLVLATVAIVATVAIPYLSGVVVDAIHNHHRHRLVGLALLVLAAGTVRLAVSAGRRLVAGRVSLGVEYDLRNLLFRQLQSLELAFFDHQQTGQLMSRATVDLQSIRFFLGYGLVFILQSGLTIALAAVAMFALQPTLAAIALIPVPFVVYVAHRYSALARPALQEVQQRVAELTADTEENISGVRVVKAFAREAHQRARFERSVRRVFEQSMVEARLQARYNPLIGFLPQAGLAAILLVGGRDVIHHQLSIGQFTAFYTYLLMLLSPMRTLGVSLNLAQRATASGVRVFQLLDRAPRLTAPPGAPPLPPGNGNVRFEAVTMRYGAGSPPALADIDLDVAGGRTIALVGATGSGKTTLVALVARLYDPVAGRVLIDGADLRDVDVASVRAAVAITGDDPFLFSTTVHDNIAYARSDATREQVIEAARRAQAHEFIERLPEGYDTRVGERGLTVSGGQRQRIAIARAILADPRILILDDATSSVDASTEREIKRALAELMAGRTTFIIAHRLSTITLADEILVLEGGRVGAHGSHDELLASSPLYREIVEKGLPDSVFLTRKPLEREVIGF
ncbi:MAG TPA: ABC transporter ATP-binding protein [Solirubrobacteraceae bacterium]|nr:ABC transporter ATP-binding protein [Solirubrobacteraceae bacterium]